jgi:hypothetical protein
MSPLAGRSQAVTSLRWNWPLPNLGKLDFCGRPFLGVSIRAFTASPNAEKGTPTAQPFDNRSIV